MAVRCSLALVLLAAACDDGGDGGTGDNRPTRGVKRGTLRVYSHTDVDALDPGVAYATFDFALLRGMVRELYSFDTRAHRRAVAGARARPGRRALPALGRRPHLHLPEISFAAWSRYQRATMLDVLGSDYIRLARAKGLSRSRVMTRHALRNALIPLVTVVAIDIGAVFGGAIITERVFSWQGMGALLVQGVETSDVNVLLAWLMVTSVLVVLFNLIADVLYAVLDPRIRYG